MGRYYELSISIDSEGNDKNYTVYTLSDDWMVEKGFKMAYDHFMKATKEERAALGTQTARWEDFRVRSGVVHDELHSTKYDQALNDFVLSQGEFALTEVTDAAGTQRVFTWSASPTGTEYGILIEYDKTGNAQSTPDSASSTGPQVAYENLTDDMDGTQAFDLQSRGNLPPYDQNGVNAGTPWIRVGVLRTGTGGEQRLSTGNFVAPCGLVLITSNSPVDDFGNVAFKVKSGDYKGVHAPSMLE